MNHRRRETLYDLLKKLPQLEDCRIIGPCSQSVRLKLQETSSQSHLKTLWLGESKPFYGLPPERLDHLVSLVLGDDTNSTTDWREILKKPSLTLKHLSLTLNYQETRAKSSLHFPKLKALELNTRKGTDRFSFPRWMSIPIDTILINASTLSLPLPPISTLWVYGVEHLSGLTAHGPKLQEFRIITSGNAKFDDHYRRLFKEMLEDRSALVENEFEEQGVRFIKLKTLVLQFDAFGLDFVESLKPFVEKILDLKTMDNFIEVEV